MNSKAIIKRSDNKGKSAINLSKELRSMGYFKSIEDVSLFLEQYSKIEIVELELSDNKDAILEALEYLEFNFTIDK